MLIHAIFTLLRGGSVDFTSVMMSILAVLFVMFAILPLHEYAHAWMANKLGDSTALQAGRHTINPLASFDPLGALFLLLFGFGWAKPVPVDPRRFKNPRRDMALTALAGPVSNVLAALVGALLYLAVAIFAFHYVVPDWLFYFFSYYITVNASLAVFNLLPLPPLDGSKVVGAFLSGRAMYQYYRYQNQIMLVVFLLIFSGALDVPLSYLQSALTNGIFYLAELPFRLFGVL